MIIASDSGTGHAELQTHRLRATRLPADAPNVKYALRLACWAIEPTLALPLSLSPSLSLCKRNPSPTSSSANCGPKPLQRPRERLAARLHERRGQQSGSRPNG